MSETSSAQKMCCHDLLLRYNDLPSLIFKLTLFASASTADAGMGA